MSDSLEKKGIQQQTNGGGVNNSGEERSLVLNLQALENEEGLLLEEKRALVDVKEKLCRIREEIEERKRRIEALKNEIAKLKYQCEELANVLSIPVRK